MNPLDRTVEPTALDPLPGLAGFARALWESGTQADEHRVQAFLTAIGQLDAAVSSEIYWAGRLTLCAEPDDLIRYDAAFAAWFGDMATATGNVSPAKPRQISLAALSTDQDGGGAGESEEDGERDPLAVAASDVERLRHRDLGDLSPAEREHLRMLLARLDLSPPLRAALRRRPARRGKIDPRRTLRAMVRAGAETTRLRHRDRRRRPRKVVLLIDVSGSMAPYADALLRFAHVVSRRSPATTEVFTMGTRLSRLTKALKQRDSAHALAAAAREVPDFSGGTRLGETLKVFLDRWGQRGVARRAVVVVFSDGWERGDPSLLGAQLARTKLLAHAVLWVNPHAGRAGYEPVQSGIRAALPVVDRLLAGHSLATLDRVLREIRRA